MLIKKYFNKIVSYLRYNFGWLNVYNTPFKGIKPKFYFGEISVGTPYFLPRKVKRKTGKFVDVTWFGIDYVPLGWKTKYDDIRFEWNPLLSIVLFNRQFVIWFIPNIDCEADHAYWEAYLYYKYRTDKTKTKMERFMQCITEFSTTWVRYLENNEKETFDYYHCILKKRYNKKYLEWKQENTSTSVS